MKQRPLLSFIVKLALSLLFLALIFRAVDVASVWDHVLKVDVLQLALSIGLFFPAQLLMAYRWHWLLKTLGHRFSYQAVLHHNLRGQFAALFLPGQLSGDIVRGVSIARGSSGKSTLALSIIIDKVALLAALAIVACAGGFWSPVLDQVPNLILSSAMLLIITVVALLLLAFLRIQPNRLAAMSGMLPRPLRRFSDALLFDLSVPTLSLKLMSLVLMLALAVQLISTLGGFFLMRAMGIPIAILDWAAINAVVAVAQIFPLSIGGIGVREGILIGMLSLYGVGAAAATAFSLLSFFFVALLVSLSWLMSDLLVKQVRPALQGETAVKEVLQ